MHKIIDCLVEYEDAIIAAVKYNLKESLGSPDDHGDYDPEDANMEELAEAVDTMKDLAKIKRMVHEHAAMAMPTHHAGMPAQKGSGPVYASRAGMQAE